jgi:hypothetical protein
MLWILLALAGLAIVVLAARDPRFRKLAEPALSVLVAIGLISAFVIWWNDDNAKPRDPVSPVTQDSKEPGIAEANVRLEGLTFTRGTPAGSYVVTGVVHNDGTALLNYFTLVVTLDDCPDEACQTIGSDDALVIARIPPGHSAPLRTTLVLPEPLTGPPVAPRWTTGITKIQSSRATP